MNLAIKLCQLRNTREPKYHNKFFELIYLNNLFATSEFPFIDK